ncbi:Uncharacterized protein dnm_036380 [Desulfonema magnum]|uniref:Uncharacterized protein n=1 Tax=Desulfonema magnum TaxID=45655 RepID=A0A975BLF9_9BACT|nr:Uncharacterized protein dnm_036380 [Desulfonema magnum]
MPPKVNFYPVYDFMILIITDSGEGRPSPVRAAYLQHEVRKPSHPD